MKTAKKAIAVSLVTLAMVSGMATPVLASEFQSNFSQASVTPPPGLFIRSIFRTIQCFIQTILIYHLRIPTINGLVKMVPISPALLISTVS